MIEVHDRPVDAGREPGPPATERLPGNPSILVAIASYGTAQDHFLAQVIDEYLKLDTQCRIVVLSNIDKPVKGAEVLVGLPSKDTYSLPFAHRPLFRENAGKYDLFVYTEDDTLITPANLRAFLEVQAQLADGEIAGFVRSETDRAGRRYIVSANYHFRWLPETVEARGRDTVARFSNQHSGCFIATRAQLQRAIDSGGFTVEPRAGRYGMLETAASDIYTQCGLRRVICLSRIEDFIVPHLANKYHGAMGVAFEEFESQVRALQLLRGRGAAARTLFDPETRAPGFRWSKNLYRGPDTALLGLLPTDAKQVLSIGAAAGGDELELVRSGVEVSAVPLDPVFGASLARRGVEIAGDSIAAAARGAPVGGFGAVLFADALHLMIDPQEALHAIARLLSGEGVLVGSVSNTSSLFWPLRDWHRGLRVWHRPEFERDGAHPMKARRLGAMLAAAGLRLERLVPVGDGVTQALSRVPTSALRRMLAPRLLFRARRVR